MKRNLLAAIFLFCFLIPVLGQNRNEKVDAYIREKMKSRNIPGLSLAIVRDGKIIYSKGYGMANLELSVPASDKTNFQIYSTTKIFTAMAVMMLIEEGKLSLDEPVSKHLSGISSVGKSITVRQLLSHTSGIRDYHDRPYAASEEIYDDTLPDCEKWAANFTLVSAPGERWAYIGTGYFLLGMLIEKISGKPFEQFLRERIFIPIGMKETRLVTFDELIPNRAAGYSWKGGAFHNASRINPVVEFAKGGVISNVLDMAKLDAALYTEKLLKRATLQEMWTNARLNNGEIVTSYGLGFGLTPFRGRKRAGHTGGGPGFVAAYTRFIEDDLTVIVLANADQEEIRIGEMANEIAAFYFPK